MTFNRVQFQHGTSIHEFLRNFGTEAQCVEAPRQDSTHWLGGVVHLDGAYLDGERAGGKAGRGAEKKGPFVAAGSPNGKGHPMHLKLNPVSGFTSAAIGNGAKADLAAGATLTSDGLACFAAVVEAGCAHVLMVVDGLEPRDLPVFKWVNTVLGNLKTTLTGAYQSLKYRKYAANSLAAFAYRLNRRLDLRDLVSRLIDESVPCAPIKETVIRQHAEAGF